MCAVPQTKNFENVQDVQHLITQASFNDFTAGPPVGFFFT